MAPDAGSTFPVTLTFAAIEEYIVHRLYEISAGSLLISLASCVIPVIGCAVARIGFVIHGYSILRRAAARLMPSARRPRTYW